MLIHRKNSATRQSGKFRASLLRAGYTVLGYGLSPLILLYLFYRSRRQPAYLEHLGERLGSVPFRTSQAPLIWIHAVSVGETRAAQPLIEKLLETYPEHEILITHMTPTGRATSTELFAQHTARLHIHYLPYDFPFAIHRFLKRMRPALLLLMETELWPNLIHEAKKAGCKVALINARLSEKSLRKTQRVSSLARHALLSLDEIAAQTYPDAARLQSLCGRSPSVTGNLKFDIWPTRQQTEAGQALRAQCLPRGGKTRPILLLASTRDGEEALLLKAHADYVKEDWLLILVPRHPQRFDAVADWLRMHGVSYQRRSANEPIQPETQVLLGDTMGEMFVYYEACDVAFIGGSLLPLGGQNLIEACAVGRPVLIGEHTFNFAEATAQAIEAGAAARVRDAEQVFLQMQRLQLEPTTRETMAKAALAFSQRHRGATQRTLDLINPLLSQ